MLPSRKLSCGSSGIEHDKHRNRSEVALSQPVERQSNGIWEENRNLSANFDIQHSQIEVLWIQPYAHSDSEMRKRMRRLNSGPVTVMVYGFDPAWNYRDIYSTCLSSRVRTRTPSTFVMGLLEPGRQKSAFQSARYNVVIAMHLRPATAADLPFIIALERAPVAREFVGQWSEDRHRSTMASSDARYYVSETERGEVEAYAILRGLEETSSAIELKRIVVGTPARGLGRRILKELMRIAFREMRAHRLYLDVFDHNARARHLYESLGFRYEGVMREAARRDGHWCDLHLMSMLESEYN